MKRVIYKYDLNRYHTVLNLPARATFLHFDTQHENALRVWVSVPADVTALEERTFEVVGTGEVYEARGRVYLGTAMVAGGLEVWHLFEALPED